VLRPGAGQKPSELSNSSPWSSIRAQSLRPPHVCRRWSPPLLRPRGRPLRPRPRPLNPLFVVVLLVLVLVLVVRFVAVVLVVFLHFGALRNVAPPQVDVITYAPQMRPPTCQRRQLPGDRSSFIVRTSLAHPLSHRRKRRARTVQAVKHCVLHALQVLEARFLVWTALTSVRRRTLWAACVHSAREAAGYASACACAYRGFQPSR